MADDWEFTEEEIRHKLSELGYSNIPREKLKEFANDLKELIKYESLHEEKPNRFYSATDTSTSNTDHTDTSTTETETTPEGESCVVPRRYALQSSRRGLGHIPYGKENNLYTIKEMDTPSSDGSTPTDNNRLNRKTHSRKRKVLRKKNGESRVFDESFTSTDSGSMCTDISDIEQQLRDLPLQDLQYGGIDDSLLNEPLDYRPWDKQKAYGALPSYIRPSTSHPHTRHIKKCDPVSRYRQFSREWENNKVPGEKNRNSLRWNVRGQLLQSDVFERPQRRYIPNKYVVPTEKKRQSLRWEVRTNLARS